MCVIMFLLFRLLMILIVTATMWFAMRVGCVARWNHRAFHILLEDERREQQLSIL